MNKLVDVEMTLRRHRGQSLDPDAVRERVAPLLVAKDDSESIREFERLLRRVAG